MKIALVCPYAWDRPGGVQTHVRALASVLRGRGHEVLVVAPTSAPVAAEDGVTHAGRTIPVPANGSVAPITFGPGAAAAVHRALREYGPDVMHLHEPLVPSLSLLALLRPAAAAVGTFHAATDRSAGYALGRPLLSRAADKLSVRTAVSDAARQLVAQYFPGDYTLTPNGIDVPKFATARPAGLGERRTLLFLGRLERRKGLEVLLQAMTRLRDLDVRLIVAGTGPHERRYRALARSLRVDSEWLGRVPDEDVPGLYAGADVYCAPGLGGESFGIVLIEAMAAGTAVVCSDLPVFRAVAGGAAEFAATGDAGDLAHVLRRVLTDDGVREQMRRQGSRLAAMYDWKRLVAGVEEVYRRAVT